MNRTRFLAARVLSLTLTMGSEPVSFTVEQMLTATSAIFRNSAQQAVLHDTGGRIVSRVSVTHICSAAITVRITRRRQATNHSNNPDFAARRVSDGYGPPPVRWMTAMSQVIAPRWNVDRSVGTHAGNTTHSIRADVHL
ncbi:MAG: hypothetical protein AAF802_30175 [Planctomycetota bacterium]